MIKIELNEQQKDWLLMELKATKKLPTSDFTQVIASQIINKLEDHE